MHKFRQALTVYGVLFFTFTLNACATGEIRDWPEQTGRVLEEGSDKPLAGAIVVARWQGQTSSIAESRSVCYHVETVVTDGQGQYHTPPWQESFRHGVINDKVVNIKVYKPGYEESDLTYSKIRSYRQHVYYLKPFKGTRGERLEYMFKLQYSLRCGRSAGVSSLNLNKLINAMYEEAMAFAVTEKEKKKAEKFKTWLYKRSDVEGPEVIDTEHGWKKQ